MLAKCSQLQAPSWLSLAWLSLAWLITSQRARDSTWSDFHIYLILSSSNFYLLHGVYSCIKTSFQREACGLGPPVPGSIEACSEFQYPDSYSSVSPRGFEQRPSSKYPDCRRVPTVDMRLQWMARCRVPACSGCYGTSAGTRRSEREGQAHGTFTRNSDLSQGM